MTHGSLFSGIGGFDLASEWMGWDNVFHCEWNDFGKRVLKYYWPNAISYDDITKTDFTIHRGQIDILTGGFPCQPYSTAGKRLGKEDDRHLWPEMLRAIREIKPKYIVGENVSGLLSWNGGLVFNEVQTDLEAEGYEVQPVLLPACAINAPHRRDRIWFVAKSSSERCNDRSNNREERHLSHNKDGNATESKPKGNGRQCGTGEAGYIRNATNTERKRQPKQRQPKRSLHKETNREWKASWSHDDGRWPTQSPICNGDDGISSELDFDAVWQGVNPRKPYITFSKWRQESIKAGGNAIVPQVAYQIFKALEKTG